MPATALIFEDYCLDRARGELTRDGKALSVEPQVLDLIGFLAENAGRVVTRDEIIARVWDGRIVSDSAISTRINAARAALGDDGTAQHIFPANNGFCEDLAQQYDRARDAALAAVAADDKEPYAHAVLGWVHQWRDHAMDRAFAELDRAVELNPGSAHYRCLRAFAMTYAGRCEEALATLTEGMRLNPHYPVAYHIFLGRALFHLHRFAEAMPHLERVRSAQPHHPNALALVAACYAALGHENEARETVAEIRRANPAFTIGFVTAMAPYVRDDDRALFLTMLARAGLPE